MVAIYSSKTDEEMEVCQAWGYVSNTSEIDFRDITCEDNLGYNLVVKPATFKRFVETIKCGNVDKIYFSAGHVSGLYSEWSPSFSTDRVKVLAGSDDQVVEGSESGDIKLPRLGAVGEWTISFNRLPALRVPVADEYADETDRGQPSNKQSATIVTTDPQIRRLLQSLRIAAWWAVTLIAVLVVKELVR